MCMNGGRRVHDSANHGSFLLMDGLLKKVYKSAKTNLEHAMYRFFVLCCLSLTLVLAGCGDDDSSDDAVGTTPSTAPGIDGPSAVGNDAGGDDANDVGNTEMARDTDAIGGADNGGVAPEAVTGGTTAEVTNDEGDAGETQTPADETDVGGDEGTESAANSSGGTQDANASTGEEDDETEPVVGGTSTNAAAGADTSEESGIGDECGTVHTVTSTDNFSSSAYMDFEPEDLTIDVGDCVDFEMSNTHNAIEVSQANYESRTFEALENGFSVNFGETQQVRFTEVGVHYYVCVPHVFGDMVGTITVR